MYNIKVLEEEWKRYNRKKKRPLVLLLVGILLLVVSTVVVLETDILDWYGNSAAEESPQEEIVKVGKVFIDRPLKTLEQRESILNVDVPMDVGVNSVISSKKEFEQHTKKKKIHIEVIDASVRRSSLTEIEKRFRMAPDTDDSLFLARSYYQKRNYKKAEYWALQTNKINDKIEESWLVFAKAKAKRGHRNEAIKILNSYIKKNNSIEAKVLLNKIKEGKI